MKETLTKSARPEAPDHDAHALTKSNVPPDATLSHWKGSIRTSERRALWSDGTRFRVVDRWISYDHHGRFGEGLHVFLEPVEKFGDDDRLGNLAPDYFT